MCSSTWSGRPGSLGAEKNERIGRVVAMIAEAKGRFALPMRAPASEMRLGVATLLGCGVGGLAGGGGQVAVGRRGPQKVKLLNLGELKEQIQGPWARWQARPGQRVVAPGLRRRDLSAGARCDGPGGAP